MSDYFDVWYSADGGRRWRQVITNGRSVIGAYLRAHPDGEYDDGYGNLYRLDPPKDTP